MQTVNFQKAKRNFINFEFADGVDGQGREKTKIISVGMPKKKMFDLITNLQNSISDGMPEMQQMDEMFRLSALLLSNNIQNIQITKDWVEDTMDFEDIQTLFTSYVQFCKGEAASPN